MLICKRGREGERKREDRNKERGEGGRGFGEERVYEV